MVEELLKSKKIKLTKARITIYNVIANSKEEVSIKYIINNCFNEIDKVTIYRTLDLFCKKLIITKNVDYDGNIYYVINKKNHEHYINCIKCHKKEKLDFCPFTSVSDKIESQSGFQVINHNIELSGLCSECKKKL